MEFYQETVAIQREVNALECDTVLKSMQRLHEAGFSKHGGNECNLTGWAYFILASNAAHAEEIKGIPRSAKDVSGWVALKRISSGILMMQYVEGPWKTLKNMRKEIVKKAKQTQTWKLHNIRMRACENWNMQEVGSVDG